MMRRRVALVGMLVLATGLFGACGSGDGDDARGGGSGMGMDHGGDMDHMGGDDDAGASPVAEGARRVAVSASSFAFEPDEIEAEVGEDLAIALTSEDIPHDFVVDELDVHVSVGAGDTEIGGVRADEPGRYAFYCSVPGHRSAGMEGTLVVG